MLSALVSQQKLFETKNIKKRESDREANLDGKIWQQRNCHATLSAGVSVKGGRGTLPSGSLASIIIKRFKEHYCEEGLCVFTITHEQLVLIHLVRYMYELVEYHE